LLVDVAPVDVGIELPSGRPGVVIPRNTWIPTTKECVVHLPPGVRGLRIYQGPGRRPLGEIDLGNVVPSGEETTRLEISFSLSSSCLLDVRVLNPSTRKDVQARIFPFSGLGPGEAERLRREAEQEELLRWVRL